MGIKRMQGVSAELEYIGPRGRKRKKNCVFYFEGICKNAKINNYLCKCVGRMFCSTYTDIINNENDNKGQQNYREFLNKKITLLNIKENEIIKITIVEDKYEDIFNNKFSIKSQIGQALVNCKNEKEFEIKQGTNIIKYRIKEIE